MAGPPRGSSQPTPATSHAVGTHTRKTQSQSNDQFPTIEELEKAARVAFANTKTAKDFLERQGHSPKGEEPSLSALSHILLLLASSTTGKVLTDGVKSVAILLGDDATETASRAT